MVPASLAVVEFVIYPSLNATLKCSKDVLVIKELVHQRQTGVNGASGLHVQPLATEVCTIEAVNVKEAHHVQE